MSTIALLGTPDEFPEIHGFRVNRRTGRSMAARDNRTLAEIHEIFSVQKVGQAGALAQGAIGVTAVNTVMLVANTARAAKQLTGPEYHNAINGVFALAAFGVASAQKKSILRMFGIEIVE